MAYVDPWDMLNYFCFHVYAQKWLFVIMSHVTCLMSNSYVDPWDMLNNFCSHVYAQMFMGENGHAFFGPRHPPLWLDQSKSWFPAKNFICQMFQPPVFVGLIK